MASHTVFSKCLRSGFVALLVTGFFSTALSLRAEPVEHVLSGRIMDTSDNWLPDVRVALQRQGAVTHTDGNGLFELRFVAAEPLAVGDDGAVDVLELVKEGHRTRLVRVTSVDWFNAPIEEKMVPDPVGEDTVGFIDLIPNGTIAAIARRIEVDEPHQYTAEQLREQLDNLVRRPRNPTTEASFHAWVPESVERVRAAFLISLHGMGTIDHPVLRRFAEENNIALVGVQGVPIQRGAYPVDIIDPYLERLGELTGHPELATVPVFTFGHSNGTGFATVYAVDRPERLIGWISYHSGHAWQLLLPGVENVPGLVMHGQLDRWLDNGQEQAVKDLRSQRNAPVAMMLEGNVGHGPVDPVATWEFIVEYCNALLRTRLNEDGTLRPAVIEEGWLGGLYDRSIGDQQLLPIAPYAEFDGDRSTANWLPDAEFAEIWQVYGTVNPRR